MIAGQADATILDLSNKNKIMAEAGDKFNVLPMFDVDASDEALFANLDWIKDNERAGRHLRQGAAERLAGHGRRIPTIIRRETNPNGPIGQLPAEILDELDGFYKDAVEGGLYDPNGGGRKAAMADMEWYTAPASSKAIRPPSTSRISGISRRSTPRSEPAVPARGLARLAGRPFPLLPAWTPAP